MATSVFPAFASNRSQRPGVLYPYAHWWFLLCIVTTWVGFARSYFAVIRSEPLLHHVHGALMGGWIALLIVQPILYQRGNLKLHRTLGRWGAFVLIPAMVVVGALMVRSMFHFTQIPPFVVDRLAFLDLNSLVDIPFFVAMAIYTARDVQRHARWIVCTVVMMMPPAIVRAMPMLPVFRHSFPMNVNLCVGFMALVLLVLMLDDWRKAGKVYPPYPVAFVLNLFALVGSNWVGGWSWWHHATVLMGRSA